MRKQLLIEYIKGETSPQQREEVMRWPIKMQPTAGIL